MDTSVLQIAVTIFIIYERMTLGSFKNVSKKWVYKSYIFNIYVKQDLILNGQQ